MVAEQAAAVAEQSSTPTTGQPTRPAAEPLAEWEIALQQEEAARSAAQATGGDEAGEPEAAETTDAEPAS